MENFCRNCGKELEENAKVCRHCGKQVAKKTFLDKKLLILIPIIIIILLALSFMFLHPSTQIVKVDNVEFELPSDYVNEPSRTEVSTDENVKSSAMGWSNDKHYIEIGVTRPIGSGINGDEIASKIGGTPTKMYGYTGYLLEYADGGHAFVFGMKDKVCMIYVSDYDGFGDVKVIG